MRHTPQEFKFQFPYSNCAMIFDAVSRPTSYAEIGWDEPETVGCLAKFSRLSLLHRFIYGVLQTEYMEVYNDTSREREEYEEWDETLSLAQCFSDYNMEYVRYSAYSQENAGRFATEEEMFRYWQEWRYAQFCVLFNHWTEEVFYILFSNRQFLFTFHKNLADCLRSGKVTIPADFRTEKGTLKRDSRIPQWAKNAVFYRDHGRCVFCQKDLTGLLATDQRAHYDHMVPLDQFGVNDPTNLQLLCEPCNTSKGGTKAQCGVLYPIWWPSDS